MSELKARLAYFSEDDYDKGAHKICAKVSDCGYDRRNEWWSYAFEDEVYIKSEADKVIADLEESHKKEVEQLLMEIEEIVKGAISMFRLSDKCRGLDLKSPLGRIANTAFKHWCFVESIQNKNQQLQEDKERLLQNNHHLLDEVERLKEDVADARQKACEFQEIINEKEAQLNHANYKRCLAMAMWCESKVYHIRRTPLGDMSEHEYWQYENDFWQKWEKRWLELAEKFKEAK